MHDVSGPEVLNFLMPFVMASNSNSVMGLNVLTSVRAAMICSNFFGSLVDIICCAPNVVPPAIRPHKSALVAL